MVEPVSDFDRLTREQLELRLRYAEDVCLMFGWLGVRGTERDEAATELWIRWAALVGHDYTGPDAHPELVGAEAALARRRRETLAGFAGDKDDLVRLIAHLLRL